MQDFLIFRKMITPLFIQIIFWIGVALIEIVGIVTIVGAVSRGSALRQMQVPPETLQFYNQMGVKLPAPPSANSGPAVLRGVLIMLIGPIGWRIECELLIVIFRIQSELRAIPGFGWGGSPVPATPIPPR
jgi:hypothetical protein